MNKINKLWGFLYKFYVLLTAFLIFLVIFLSSRFPTYGLTVRHYVMSALLCAAGLIAGSIIYTLLHESGHVLAVKSQKAVILECSVLGFLFSRSTKKDKRYDLSFHPTSAYQGYVSFACPSYDKADKIYYKSIVYALISSMFCTAAFLLIFVLWRNFFAYSVFGGATVASFYLTALNFFSFMPTSDGAELFSAKENAEAVRCGLEIQSRLYYGQTLADMPSDLFLTKNAGQYCEYYSYLRLLQKGNAEKAFSYLDELTRKYAMQKRSLSVELEIELFFKSVINGDKEAVEKDGEAIVSLCELNPSPLSDRVMIAYRKFCGDEQWEQTIRKRFDDTDEFKLIGLLRTEKAIVGKIIDKEMKNVNDG